eukprot:1192660-Prorocentrum_minimum.AAC.2
MLILLLAVVPVPAEACARAGCGRRAHYRVARTSCGNRFVTKSEDVLRISSPPQKRSALVLKLSRLCSSARACDSGSVRGMLRTRLECMPNGPLLLHSHDNCKVDSSFKVSMV